MVAVDPPRLHGLDCQEEATDLPIESLGRGLLSKTKLRTLPLSFSAGSSKIKIQTSSRHKANLALWRDEVRILIFDDPAEQERGQRPEFRSAQLDSST